MNRPRIVAVVSAILGSTAGCLVLSRWRLAGTITGAVIVPVIYTLVSHCSTESLDRLGRCARRLVHRGRADDTPPETETDPLAGIASVEAAPGVEAAPTVEAAPIPTSRTGGGRLQWSLAAFALLAFATSIYSLVEAEPARQTIVREKVIANTIVEKTVTVTNPILLGPAAVVDPPASSSTTVSSDGGAQGTGGGEVTTSSTSTTLPSESGG